MLTYGTIVAQLCKDYDSDYVEVNKQLDKMGYNIGLRLIEDYLAKSNTMRRCSNFKETAEMIAKVRRGSPAAPTPTHSQHANPSNHRLGSKSSSTSPPPSPTGRATANSSPSCLTRTPLPTLSNCPTTAAPRTSSGTRTFFVVSCAERWRWSRCRSRRTSSATCCGETTRRRCASASYGTLTTSCRPRTTSCHQHQPTVETAQQGRGLDHQGRPGKVRRGPTPDTWSALRMTGRGSRPAGVQVLGAVGNNEVSKVAGPTRREGVLLQMLGQAPVTQSLTRRPLGWPHRWPCLAHRNQQTHSEAALHNPPRHPHERQHC